MAYRQLPAGADVTRRGSRLLSLARCAGPLARAAALVALVVGVVAITRAQCRQAQGIETPQGHGTSLHAAARQAGGSGSQAAEAGAALGAAPAGPFEPLPEGQDDSYAALCIAVKDEHCDIREWVLYHASVGVRRVYLWDTESSPPMRPVLEDLIATGLVKYHFMTNASLPGYPDLRPTPGNSLNWQSPVFASCLRLYGRNHTWMGFIDADEFIVLQDGVPSVPALLRRYEAHPGLVLHWRYFSFDGHIERPPGGVLASYTACCHTSFVHHRTIKSIVQPRFTRWPKTTHNFVYKKRVGPPVNTAGTPVEGTLVNHSSLISYEGAALYHYCTKSLRDFEAKMRRRGGAGGQKKLSDFLLWHTKCRERCGDAVPLGRALAARWDLRRGVPDACAPPAAPAGGAAAGAAAAAAQGGAAVAAAGEPP